MFSLKTCLDIDDEEVDVDINYNYEGDDLSVGWPAQVFDIEIWRGQDRIDINSLSCEIQWKIKSRCFKNAIAEIEDNKLHLQLSNLGLW